MAFPETRLPVHVELLVNNAWTEVTEDVVVRDDGGRITIQRGASSESAEVEPGRCEFTLDNRTGKYSPRNPSGTYYGQIGRNTRVRVSVDAGDSYLDLPGDSGDRISAPDAAALDITGDIDIRMDVTFETWASGTVELISKWTTTGNQRSWYLLRNANRGLTLAWSTDGSATTSYAGTEIVPVPTSRRIALRATLDVNNGSGGYTVTYYWAPTIDGDWTQFEQEVTTGGTTSIFSSTSTVEIGDLSSLANTAFEGKVHKVEIRNGIGGTAVADPDFRIQTPGDNSFADTAASPNTWTVAGNAAISNKKIRFNGEMTAWPIEWDTSGTDIYVNAQASGILRRLGAGARPLESPLRRQIPTHSPLAYWPMEEESSATQFYSPVSGVTPIKQSGMELGSDSTLAGSKPLPVIRSGAYFSGKAPSGSVTNEFHAEFVFYFPEAPVSNVTVVRLGGTGTGATWELQARSGFIHINCYDSDGTSLVNTDIAATDTDLFGRWNRWQLFASQSGGNVAWTTRVLMINTTTSYSTSSTFAGTTGRLHAVSGATPFYGTGADGIVIGHIGIFEEADTDAYDDADHGFAGESSINRIGRICVEESIGLEAMDPNTDVNSEALGPQPVSTLLEIAREVETADHGILFETRDLFRLAYRDRWSLINQPVLTSVTYLDLAPGLLPVDDDQLVVNDVTVNRTNGSSARSTIDTGTLSTQDPPDGVGVYAASHTLNIETDDRLKHHASWLTHIGTTDEARFPSIAVDLAGTPSIIEEVSTLDIGSRFQITDTPTKLPPGDIDVLVRGYEESFSQFAWEIKFICVPASPYITGVLDDDELARADTDGSELVASLTSGATSMKVLATSGPTWTRDNSDTPFDVLVSGERITATDITGAAEDDFSTNQTDSWGTADVGGSWTNSGGAAGDYDVASGRGTHLLTSVDTSRRSSLDADLADVDLQVDIQTSATATGAAITGGLMARYTDIDNLYTARLAFNTNQTITLTVRKRVASVETQLATYTTALTHAANTDVRLRFRVMDSTLQAKAWTPSRPEPQKWQIETTDSALTSATDFGCRSILVTGNTNVSPIVRFDNFVCLNPTTWTVTRSVNDVVKAQSAGADVRLYRPTIVAL